MVGGGGKDDITGGVFADELWGGEGNDKLDGGLGNDNFIGGAGADLIEGGSFILGLLEGEDVSRYEGSSSQYEIEFLSDDKVRITDKIGNRDGVDTLDGVEFAQFSDKKVDLRPAQDIAFVIDTTGSMYDDIDAVKARSASIIDAIFDSSRGSLNSRVAVVGYNDPYTETFLSFTDQADPEDRKDAAIAAIDSISVGGGGDFPESVNAGLIRALSGGAGEWRKDATARKIVLFGDAPPNDPELAGQVRELAADLGVVTSSAVSSEAVSPSLYLTTFSVASNAASVPVPVQIFTVVIGDDPDAIEAFASLAADTKGASFSASDAGDVVDVLIDVLQTPIYRIEADPLSISEGNSGTKTVSFTVSRDVGDDAATVTLKRFGSSDANDAADIPSTVTFADGETFKTIKVSIEGDKVNEADETYGVRIAGIDKPATIGADSAQFLIVNDDAKANVPTRGSDNLVGTNRNDRIDALSGNDKVAGRAGADKLIGNSGNDRLFGDSGNDNILGGNGKDFLSGGAGNDSLLGNVGNDELSGGSGKDLLYGGAGADKLTGGTNTDTFRFEALKVSTVASKNRDTITDFSQGQHDRIHLADIDASGKASGNQAFHFIGDDAFGRQAGELQARLYGQNTLVSGDVNGDAKADFAILVRGHITFHADDFVL